MNENGLDTKYRPQSLARLIGHTHAVTELQGLVASNKIPKALLITGPTSAGKTTMGRAFAADINGFDSMGNINDYTELDAGDAKTIDEVRALVRNSKFKPRVGKRRIILIDEAQQILTNQHASAALLKPIEEPASQTMWILCSMDPAKFDTDKNGKAIKNRCMQYALEQHTLGDLYKQAVRIAKGEKMRYMSEDVLKLIAKSCANEMRTLANIMAKAAAHYEGLKTKPAKLDESVIQTVLQTGNPADEELVIDFLIGMYSGKFTQVQRALLDVQDAFQFLNKCIWGAKFLLNNAVLNGARHKAVWWTPQNTQLHKAFAKIKPSPNLGDLAGVLTMLIEVKGRGFAYGAIDELLSAAAYRQLSQTKGLE